MAKTSISANARLRCPYPLGFLSTLSFLNPQTEIVSGGAKCADSCAREYALANNTPLKEFLPDYRRFDRGAPLKRNLQIIEYADKVIAFFVKGVIQHYEVELLKTGVENLCRKEGLL